MTSETTTEKENKIERIFSGFAVQVQKQLTSEMHKPKKKAIILAGPTACGKSEFALQLAIAIGGEIVSADSIQVYREMNIGTSKPSKEELALVPHHLVNIRNLNEPFNVVDYYYEAHHAIQEIIAKDGVPIIVGGSGFYLHALLYGPPSGPPPVPELRKALEDELEQKGVEPLFQRLKQFDPEYASTITKNDKQKIVRALEIISQTGKKVSKLTWKARRKPRTYDYHCWFLFRPKDKLNERIENRCDLMLSKGFLDEVRELEKSGLRENSSAVQAIGYRQALEFLDSPQTEKDYQHFVHSFKHASKQYAKRQFTWFRKEPLYRWLDLDMHDPEIALDMVQKDYGSECR